MANEHFHNVFLWLCIFSVSHAVLPIRGPVWHKPVISSILLAINTCNKSVQNPCYSAMIKAIRESQSIILRALKLVWPLQDNGILIYCLRNYFSILFEFHTNPGFFHYEWKIIVEGKNRVRSCLSLKGNKNKIKIKHLPAFNAPSCPVSPWLLCNNCNVFSSYPVLRKKKSLLKSSSWIWIIMYFSSEIT